MMLPDWMPAEWCQVSMLNGQSHPCVPDDRDTIVDAMSRVSAEGLGGDSVPRVEPIECTLVTGHAIVLQPAMILSIHMIDETSFTRNDQLVAWREDPSKAPTAGMHTWD